MDNINNKTNAEAARKYTGLGLKTKNSGKIESASGPGSSLLATKKTAKFLNKIFKKYNITSVLDLGCGDWNWMQHINYSYTTGSRFAEKENVSIKYTGWDIHEKMIESHNQQFGGANVSFEVKDIIADEYPVVDMIICRDVLFHLEIDLGLKVINKVRNFGAKFFLSTSFTKVKENTNIKKYNDIDGWGYYDINLNIEPFNLRDLILDRVYERNQKRYMYLYGIK